MSIQSDRNVALSVISTNQLDNGFNELYATFFQIVGTWLLSNELYISYKSSLIATKPLIALSSLYRDFFTAPSRLLNFSTSCLTKVVKLGSNVPSSAGFKCYFNIRVSIVGGRFFRLATTFSTCSSGVISEDVAVTGCKLKIVLMILLDYWVIKIMLALGCNPNTTGSSKRGNVSMYTLKSWSVDACGM